MHELMAANDGYQRLNMPERPEPMSRDEYEDLKQKLENAGS